VCRELKDRRCKHAIFSYDYREFEWRCGHCIDGY
jgi:hypothetical protein